tara:strand:+ start:1292 stop:1528 length:237 start_codon:yes stop_codon:yes gene_type:complete
MKITTKDEVKQTEYPLINIADGEVFIAEGFQNHILMKMDERADDDHDDILIVSLEDGILMRLNKYEIVTIIPCELRLK